MSHAPSTNQETDAGAAFNAHEAWLRGYFSVERFDVKNSKRTSVRRKNIDYLRLKDLALHLLDIKPGMRVLDVGCANGPMMVYCGLQGAIVSGVDLDPGAVAVANDFLRRYKVQGEAVVGDAMKLDFPDNTFDALISGDFVEHITDDVKVAMFKEALRVLKPGARVVIKTPNLAYLKASLRFKQLRAVMRFENPFDLIIPHTPGTEDPQHIGLVDRWGLRDSMLAAGFLNYQFVYAPLRRFGTNKVVEVLSTEIPLVRDVLCEDLFVVAHKPIVVSHFPD